MPGGGAPEEKGFGACRSLGKWRTTMRDGGESHGKAKKRGGAALCLLLVAALSILPASSPAFAAVRPEIAAEGAALYRADSGEFLYEKNGDVQYYPASITKLMTALLTLENCAGDEELSFSREATENLESGAVNLALSAGDRVSVRDCLYGLLLKSANDVANGLAEHVAGSVPAFAARMNERAKELGCTGSHFVNPNGLTDAKHVATPRDMALIARACFERADFRELESSAVHHFPATAKRPEGTTIVMGHKMLSPGSSLYYPGAIGGKTGYTRAAGNTLVTCAERDGVRLIAVIMKSRATHYADTKKLLDYGFALAAEEGGGKSGGERAGAVPQGEAPPESVAEGVGGRMLVAPVPGPEAESGPGIASPGWKRQGELWYYEKQNGARAADERLEIGGFEYWFDEQGRMLTGWKQDAAGDWYYLRPSSGGMRKSCWMEENGKWYYFSGSGKMLRDAETPDGYWVNQEGIWVE